MAEKIRKGRLNKLWAKKRGIEQGEYVPSEKSSVKRIDPRTGKPKRYPNHKDKEKNVSSDERFQKDFTPAHLKHA